MVGLSLSLLEAFITITSLGAFTTTTTTIYHARSTMDRRVRHLRRLIKGRLFTHRNHGGLLARRNVRLLNCTEGVLHFGSRTYSSLVFDGLRNILAVNTSSRSTSAVLPFLLGHIDSICPGLTLSIHIGHGTCVTRVLRSRRISLVMAARHPSTFGTLGLHASPAR